MTETTATATATTAESADNNKTSEKLVTAVPIDDSDIVMADPIDDELALNLEGKEKEKQEQQGQRWNEDDPEGQKLENRRRMYKISIAVLLGILIVIGIVLSVVLVDDNDNTLPECEKELAESAAWRQRREYVIDLLAPLYEDRETTGGIDIFEPCSDHPGSEDRIAALNWLLNDTFSQTLSIVSGSGNNENEINHHNISANITNGFEDVDYAGKISILQQRYVLALLFFATGGEGWDDRMDFLQPIDICQWTTNHNKGVLCNKAGGVEILRMYWNSMSGTIPHELSLFHASLREINFGGGNIGGTIPSSLGKLTILDNLGLHDNCLTGKLPQEIMNLFPELNVIVLNNNGNKLELMSEDYSLGNLVCNADGTRKDWVMGLIVDCPGLDDYLADNSTFTQITTHNTTAAPWECDCCICCSGFSCTDLENGDTWNSAYLNEYSKNGKNLKAFQDSQCLTKEVKSWIATECPCIINIDPTVKSAFGKCTTNCTLEGAIVSYEFGT